MILEAVLVELEAREGGDLRVHSVLDVQEDGLDAQVHQALHQAPAILPALTLLGHDDRGELPRVAQQDQVLGASLHDEEGVGLGELETTYI